MDNENVTGQEDQVEAPTPTQEDLEALEADLVEAKAAEEDIIERRKLAVAQARDWSKFLKEAKAYQKALDPEDDAQAEARKAVEEGAASLKKVQQEKEELTTAKAVATTHRQGIAKAIREMKKALGPKRAKKKRVPPVDRVVQNGYTYPLPGTKNFAAMEVFDEISAIAKRPCKIQEALPLAESRGLALGNVRGKYSRWRQFHGIQPQGHATKEDLAALAPHFPEVGAYHRAANELAVPEAEES